MSGPPVPPRLPAGRVFNSTGTASTSSVGAAPLPAVCQAPLKVVVLTSVPRLAKVHTGFTKGGASDSATTQ